jgi:hypothetical protein
MKSRTNHPQEELQVLDHEEQPGYRVAFIIAFIVTASVLIVAFLMAGEVSVHH